MSWASRRSTTRKEDLAYCLLGIFNVNIPLLYGEGHKAFQRLQEEIIKQTNDQTLFAWGFGLSQPPEIAIDRIGPYSYLATSPSDFECCHDMVTYDSLTKGRTRSFEVTKKGLCIDIDLVIFENESRRQSQLGEVFGLLGCHRDGDLFNRIAIPFSWPKRDGEAILVMRKHGPPRLWPKHSHRAVFKTVYIIDSLPDITEAHKSSAKSDGSVIIPVMPFLSVEQLTEDPTLAITRPDGVDHLMIQEADASAPTLASGRAYFRFQPTNINTPSAYPDSLVMIAFQLSPPDDIDTPLNGPLQNNLPLDMSRNEAIQGDPHPDPSSLELPFPPGPNTLRKKTMYFEVEMKRRRERAIRERVRPTIRQMVRAIGIRERPSWIEWSKRIGNGWPYTRPCRSNPGTLHKTWLKGKVHCFITKTPTVSGELLKTPEYLKTLPWTDSARLGYKDQKFRLRFRDEEVMGYKRSVLTLTSAADGQVTYTWPLGMSLSTVAFGFLMFDESQLIRMVGLLLFGFISALGSSICLVHQNFFAGSLWMVVGMACMTLSLSRPRPDHELPMWLLIIYLTSCSLSAFFFSILKSGGLNPGLVLSVLFILSTVLHIDVWYGWICKYKIS
jgi:hypothetical protein